MEPRIAWVLVVPRKMGRQGLSPLGQQVSNVLVLGHFILLKIMDLKTLLFEGYLS